MKILIIKSERGAKSRMENYHAVAFSCSQHIYIRKLCVRMSCITLAAILLMQTKIIIIKFKLPDLTV